MTYQAPTTATLKARFPEFEPVPDERVALVLADALSEVGEDWDEQYRARAQVAIACHLMAAEGEPQRSITISSGGTASVLTGTVKRRKVGDVEVEMADASASSENHGITRTMFGSSPYGREFLRLQALSFPSFMLI